jgi:hypothetical protein
MSSKKRTIFLLLALALLLLSSLALIYSFRSVEPLHEVLPVTPTFLYPPAVMP